MAKFKIHVAQDIRAYGYVEIEADSLEAAVAKIDHGYIHEHFQPHGHGSDDLDYGNARARCLTDAYDEDGNQLDGVYIDLADEVAP